MVSIGATAADDVHVWWAWVIGVLVTWSAVAALVGVVVGRGIRFADRGTPAAVHDRSAERPALAGARTRRRAVPLPPVGIALAAVAVALETSGYLLRLTGGTGRLADLMSMDAPFSLPRLYVAALFGAAALAAFAGAGVAEGRRTWWLAVGFVAAGIATVKAGSTVHTESMSALEGAVGSAGATALSAGLAAVVVGGLWFLSRTERRDRRRVLGVLALYGAASVGLSAVSGVAAGTSGAFNWYATATYLEESGEALAGVAFLVAVLVGVAPRLVLPAEWALRRQADAQSLELPEMLPGRAEGPARG